MGLLFNRKGPSAKNDGCIIHFRVNPFLCSSEKKLFSDLDKYLPGVFNKKLKKDLVKMIWDAFNGKVEGQGVFPTFYVTAPSAVGNSIASGAELDCLSFGPLEGVDEEYCTCASLKGCCGVSIKFPEGVIVHSFDYSDVVDFQFLLPSLKEGVREIRYDSEPIEVTMQDIRHIEKVGSIEFEEV